MRDLDEALGANGNFWFRLCYSNPFKDHSLHSRWVAEAIKVHVAIGS